MMENQSPHDMRRAWKILGLNTFAFTICFAAWMMNGVLITYLRDNGVFKWDAAQMGWLIGIPVFTGAIMRLPMGILTDKFGGRWVYGLLLLASAIPMYLVSYCNGFWDFFLAGLGFGMTGTGFAVGIAYTSVWFPRNRQGLALGIFGAGNAGAALTSMAAPSVLNWLTNGGANLEGWRELPKMYAGLLVLTGVIFLLFTNNKTPEGSGTKTLTQRMAPLKDVRVWRFGLYYFYVFGGFVALAQWLIPYYVNAYTMTVTTAGLLAAIFSLPSGVIRALGGWLSDRFGARSVMYWVLGISLVTFVLLLVPRMDIESPGSGIMARAAGTVTKIDGNQIAVSDKTGDETVYTFAGKQGELVSAEERHSGMIIFPRSMTWQEPVVKVGDTVAKKELLARGVTHIFFQANVWIFTFFVLIIGIVTGIGKAAVYKYIPEYYPNDVGVVGGMVGVIGALGGFICPIAFGYLLNSTGIWTTCWLFFFFLTLACLVWLHWTVAKLNRELANNATGKLAHDPELQAGKHHHPVAATPEAPTAASQAS